MALVLGVNSGFVTTAPTVDPSGGNTLVIDEGSLVSRDVPSQDCIVQEIGWWCNNATNNVSFKVGIYASDGSGGSAGTLLFSRGGNAKGNNAGWKIADGLNWMLKGNIPYWIALQLDDTTDSSTTTDEASSGGLGEDFLQGSQTNLNNPYGGGAIFDDDAMFSIYARISIIAQAGTAGTRQLNTNYPVTEGLTLGTTRLKKTNFVIRPEVSLLPDESIGLETGG